MADLDYIEALLELCDGRDLAMIKTGDVEIVFNPALGPMEDTIPPDSKGSDEPEQDMYTQLMNGTAPKFNNE